MKLPNAEQAFVPPAKITEYLLPEEKSKGKAGFFTRFGFSMAEWELLAEALYRHVSTHEVTETITDVHGTKYVVEGELTTPDERHLVIRVIWLIEEGTEAARFITAYPI